MLIVIEGTDCSGKETQSKKLVDYLKSKGQKATCFSFPMYDTPTGKIVGGPFLGKKEISSSYFLEKAPNVDGKVASLYFAADRYYNASLIEKKLKEGYIVILDRYVESNMAHQGCKIKSKKERMAMYKFLDTLEYDLLHLPKPDKVFLLYMPSKWTLQLKKNRTNLDDNEKDTKYLMKAEKTYLELAKIYNFEIIKCASNKQVYSIEEISHNLINKYENFIGKKIR